MVLGKMEAPEEVPMGSKDESNVFKGKRSKRFTPHSPVPFAKYPSLSSSSDEYQDMANCLILLAQGQSREPPKLSQPHHHHQQYSGVLYNKFNNRRFMEATSKGTGFYVYECETCNRTFPSFQALGGHCASRKKPKAALTTTTGLSDEEEGQQFIKSNNISSLSLLLSNNNIKPNKFHECSICGSEFTSGQALGGYMRRHRGSIGTNITAANTALSLNVPTPMEQPQQPKKPKNVLSLDLDLNLPAPNDDHWEPKFPLAPKQQPRQQQKSTLVFSAPTLVDCHY